MHSLHILITVAILCLVDIVTNIGDCRRNHIGAPICRLFIIRCAIFFDPGTSSDKTTQAMIQSL